MKTRKSDNPKKVSGGREKSKDPPGIIVGRGKNRRVLPVEFVVVPLSEEENNERIKRLARKILRAVAAAEEEKVRKRVAKMKGRLVPQEDIKAIIGPDPFRDFD